MNDVVPRLRMREAKVLETVAKSERVFSIGSIGTASSSIGAGRSNSTNSGMRSLCSSASQ
jgi:hypothetical protein